jgi:hypothetical protein
VFDFAKAAAVLVLPGIADLVAQKPSAVGIQRDRDPVRIAGR